MLKLINLNITMGIVWLFSPVVLAEENTSLMTYELALKASDAAEAYARKKNWNVTILVTDQDANPVMLRRLDGASIRSISFATSKALVVTQTGLTTEEYAIKLKAGEIAEIKGGVTYKGGVPVYLNGKLIGAVATSGVKDYQDNEVSIAGAENIGRISKVRYNENKLD